MKVDPNHPAKDIPLRLYIAAKVLPAYLRTIHRFDLEEMESDARVFGEHQSAAADAVLGYADALIARHNEE